MFSTLFRIHFDSVFSRLIYAKKKSSRARKFADLLIEGAIKENIEILFTSSTEAEYMALAYMTKITFVMGG